MSAKERRRRQAPPGGDAMTVGKENPKPRHRGTGPKLFSKNITRELLQKQFHLPMEEAGQLWGVSTTIVKRVCRTFGIERWPYRQIQSARKRIDALEEKLRSGSKGASEREKIEGEIKALRAKIRSLLINPNPSQKHHKTSSGAGPAGSAVQSRAPAHGDFDSFERDAASSEDCKAMENFEGTEISTPREVSYEGNSFDKRTVNPKLVGSGLTSAARKISAARKRGSRAAARAFGASSAVSSSDLVSSDGRIPRSQQGIKRNAPSPARVPIAATIPMNRSVESTKQRVQAKRAKVDFGAMLAPTDFTALGASTADGLEPDSGSGSLKGLLLGMDGTQEIQMESGVPSADVHTPIPATQQYPYAVQVSRRCDGYFTPGAARSVVGRGARAASLGGTSSGRDTIGYDCSTFESGGVRRDDASCMVGNPVVGRCEVERSHDTGPFVSAATNQFSGLAPIQPPSDKLYRDMAGAIGAAFRAESFSSETTADSSGSDETCVFPMSTLTPPGLGDRGDFGDGDTSGDSEEVVTLSLNDGDLASTLLLEIPDASTSAGDSSGGSSWPPLSGGSYLNTDDAFAAFAFSPGDIVPGAW